MPSQLHVAVDVGSRFHQVSVAAADGGVLERFQFRHQASGFGQFFSRIESLRCQQQADEVAVAMEGYNGWARPLDREVLDRGWQLFNVNNLKLARYKEIFPAPAKTDVIDADRMLELFRFQGHRHVAREVLQRVTPIGRAERELKYLTRRRRRLVTEKATRVTQLQCDLQAMAPGLLDITGAADNLWFLRFLTQRDGLVALSRLRHSTLMAIAGVGERYAQRIQAWQQQARFAADIAYAKQDIVADVHRILALITDIKTLDRRIAAVSRDSRMARRLSSTPGFGSTCAAELAGEIGTLSRFNAETSLAYYLGMAPLDNSSGLRRKAKRSVNINHRCQQAMMIAVTRHTACVPQSRAYYDRKREQGKNHQQAIRALGRHLVRVIWSMLNEDRDYRLEPDNQPQKT